MKKIIALTISIVLLVTLCACAKTGGEPAPEVQNEVEESNTENPETSEMDNLKLKINDVQVNVTWEDNESVKALEKLASEGPVTIVMSPYGGFEQVGSIGETLPSNDTNIRTQAGDIMLYTSSQMVIFYGSNSWAYTRLGKITDKSAKELGELLGGSSVTVTVTAK